MLISVGCRPSSPTLPLRLTPPRYFGAGSTSQPIDPCRRAKFDTAHPEYISPLALRVLTETEGVLKLFGGFSSSTRSPTMLFILRCTCRRMSLLIIHSLTEPTPSEVTIATRDLRLRLVIAYDNFLSSLHEATLGRLADTIGLLTTVSSRRVFLFSDSIH